MGDPRGFLRLGRTKGPARPVAERVEHYREFEATLPPKELADQASRCMDCGIPFCHRGCPLGNLIPEWNDHVYRGRSADALAALEATNNFPEITGRVCPAPCESACVLALHGAPVTIKEVERSLGDAALAGPLTARIAKERRGQRVAVVGSGPAGLAAAQQLARRGYDVTVFERSDRLGGLLRYGIPDFKLEKHMLDRRIDQMEREGVTFKTETSPTAERLRARFDAVVLALGASHARRLEVPGVDRSGVHFAMEYLTQQNRRVAGLEVDETAAVLASGKDVVILGGGDTGSDCLGTARRQGARSITQLELMPAPPSERAPSNPWPEWPLVFRTSSSQEEGGLRDFGVMTKRVLGEARLRAIEVVQVSIAAAGGALSEIAGTEREIPCDLLLLAMGFLGAEPSPLLKELGVTRDARGNIASTRSATNVPGVFAAGDAVRGASLVVWAIAEGRRAADAVDQYLRVQVNVWAV